MENMLGWLSFSSASGKKLVRADWIEASAQFFTSGKNLSCKPVLCDLTAFLEGNSSPLKENPFFFSVPHPHSCWFLLSQVTIHIGKSLHFFFIMGDLFLCATWVWTEMIARSVPSLSGIFYPTEVPTSCKVEQTSSFVFTLPPRWASSWISPTSWALKGKQGSGQKASQSNLGQWGFFITSAKCH